MRALLLFFIFGITVYCQDKLIATSQGELKILGSWDKGVIIHSNDTISYEKKVIQPNHLVIVQNGNIRSFHRTIEEISLFDVRELDDKLYFAVGGKGIENTNDNCTVFSYDKEIEMGEIDFLNCSSIAIIPEDCKKDISNIKKTFRNDPPEDPSEDPPEDPSEDPPEGTCVPEKSYNTSDTCSSLLKVFPMNECEHVCKNDTHTRFVLRSDSILYKEGPNITYITDLTKKEFLDSPYGTMDLIECLNDDDKILFITNNRIMNDKKENITFFETNILGTGVSGDTLYYTVKNETHYFLYRLDELCKQPPASPKVPVSPPVNPYERSATTWAIITLVLVVLCGVAYLGWRFLKSRQNNANRPLNVEHY